MWPSISADIAELILASTSHMITSFIFLNPKFALSALLKSATSYKLHKWFIYFLFFVLLTWFSNMLLYSTVQTVIFCAKIALKVDWITFLILKHVFAIRGRTPWHIWICFSEMLDLLFLEICYFLLAVQSCFNVWLMKIYIASRT